MGCSACQFHVETNGGWISGLDQRSFNRIIALVRSGGDRTPESFGELSREICEARSRILNDGETVRDERELKVVTIQGSIVAGIENGFLLPPAGGDAAWLEANSAELENLAKEGHQDFIEITHEMHTREDLKELVEKVSEKVWRTERLHHNQQDDMCGGAWFASFSD